MGQRQFHGPIATIGGLLFVVKVFHGYFPLLSASSKSLSWSAGIAIVAASLELIEMIRYCQTYRSKCIEIDSNRLTQGLMIVSRGHAKKKS